MCRYILDSFDDGASALKFEYFKKLAYTKLIDNETAIKGPEVDLIELTNILMDNYDLMQTDEATLHADYLSAIFFKVLLKFPSLSFFRLRHLHVTLDLLASSVIYSRE